MRLVKIEHVRCNETDWSRQTLVWAPDDMAEESIDAKIVSAQKRYLKALREFQELTEEQKRMLSVGTWGLPNYKSEPDRTKTLAQVDAEHAAKRARYDTIVAKERAAMRSFAWFLHDEGLTLFEDHDSDLVLVTLDWGHNHGLGIEYPHTPSDTMRGVAEEKEE